MRGSFAIQSRSAPNAQAPQCNCNPAPEPCNPEAGAAIRAREARLASALFFVSFARGFTSSAATCEHHPAATCDHAGVSE
eukprot:14340595-Alexandrium_andersonii.AAC.1